MDRSGDELAGTGRAHLARFRPRPFGLVTAALGLLALGFLLLPLAAVFSEGDIVAGLDSPVARDALRLSLETSLTALAVMVVVGTPIAYMLGTRDFPGKSVVVTAFELPATAQATAVYPMGIVTASGNKEAAQRWIDLVMSSQGQDVLTSHGFGPAPSG